MLTTQKIVTKEAYHLARKGIQLPQASLRAWALKLFQALGEKAASLLPDLQKALLKAPMSRRVDLVTAIGYIGPKAASFAPTLLKWLQPPSKTKLRCAVLRSFGRLEVMPLAFEKRLRKMLKTFQQKPPAKAELCLLYTSIKAIGQLHLVASRATPTLMAYLAHPSAKVRSQTCLALGRIASDPAKIVPALLKRLQDPQRDVQEAAIQALGLMGRQAASAVPMLSAMMGVPGPGKQPQAQHKRLQKQPADQQIVLRQAAVSALQGIGQASLPAFRRALYAKDKSLREVAINTIARWGMRASPAIKELLTALKDPHLPVRHRAAQALGVMISHKNVAVPHLVEALKDKHHLVRDAAIRSLLRLQAHRARKAIMKLQQDESPSVRQAVKQALRKLQR